MAFRVVTLLLVTFLTMEQCYGYPGGAPKGACTHMTPKHSDLPSNPPHLQTIDVQRTSNPNEFSVQIIGKKQGAYKGFLLKAVNVDPNGPARLGEFQPHPQAKSLDCLEPAITHFDTVLKYNPVFIFKATSPGSLKFIATVVNEYTDFYVGVESNVIQI